MKIGAPIIAVNAPTGSSAGEIIVRANVSVRIRKEAPIRNEAGRTILLSDEKISRVICGINNPTNPITPLTETIIPTSRLAKRYISVLNTFKLSPRFEAS